MAVIVPATQNFNVIGRYRQNMYTGVTCSSGDTFVVGMNEVRQIITDPPTTSTDLVWAIANATPGPGQCTLTVTASAPVTAPGINMQIIGN